MAKKLSTRQILAEQFKMPKEQTKLEAIYKTLSQTADKRLQRLEEYEKQAGFENITKWAYARAMTDIKKWGGDQAKRFGKTIPEGKMQLLAKINDMRTFLTAPTSTKQGTIAIFKKRADTINKKYDTNFSWSNIGNFFESEMYKKLDGKYDSDTIVEAFGKIQDAKEDIVEAIKDSDKIQRISDDIVNEAVWTMLEDYPDDVKELLGV